MPGLRFCIPGDPETLTGGYLYDKHMADGLRALGWSVAIERLDASFPSPTPAATQAAATLLRDFPDGDIVLIDGLALPGLSECLPLNRKRLKLIGLVHHPVALEADLAPRAAETLERNERQALAALQGLICTSHWTARELETYGLARKLIRVVPPGTRRAPRAVGSNSTTIALLSVATLTPRKGHVMLIDALAPLRNASWHLHCVGSLARDPRCAGVVSERIATYNLSDKVTLHGELPSARLDALYDGADIFVLASRLEGYGMAVAEALVRGLPIVATRAGAIPEWVPMEAGRFVAPDDTAALSGALGELITRHAVRADLAERAYAAGRGLPDWAAASRGLATALSELARE
jgi:glycosyltransferase involved in cell wall biosynthesis